ncbi:hypothetical protein D3C87_545630 [compost metagenome]|jgi:hypothetical protein
MTHIETRTIDLMAHVKGMYPPPNNNWSMKRKVKHRKFIAAKMKRHQNTLLSVIKEVAHDAIRAEHPSHSN